MNTGPLYSPDEGVIKFTCDWQRTVPLPWRELAAVNQWRTRLFRLGVIGYDERRGVGYGNVSIRCGDTDQFIITGTQTGKWPMLNGRHYTRVIETDLDRNRLVCSAPVKASSESLTHAAIYKLNRAYRAVLHGHQLLLWLGLKQELPTTGERVLYGTPEMAYELTRLYQQSDMDRKKIVVMGGHRGGLI